ncbi:heme o synthase [Lignipirellula cremea]|uniref:Protoheme IX farnesyltransferase n=1 Tax=Lignipirellula cremea TaxID=2528010 RepID=A0A518DYT7_9BACT|nr:heme o synthase [Lignipirellula cremea]QDU97013.1 Protoheme IX farnesyltransferase [Lignipirellula cremea]
MSATSSASLPVARPAWRVRALDYLELAKPRIAVLVLATVAASGYVARWGQPDPWLLLHAMLGVLLVASSASGLNQWIERRSDALMKRTADRPLPAGRLSASEVMVFSLTLLLAGVGYLAWSTNLTAAGLGLVTWVLYVLVYTPLKPLTSLNTLAGAIPGAMPVLIGWAAVGGELNPWVDPRGLAIFLLVFVWQFPHFMAIAWLYREDYSRAGLQMLTVVDPSGRRAGVQAVLCAMALLPISFVPALSTPTSGVYLVAAFLLGVGQLFCAAAFMMRLDRTSARWLLKASLIYLPLMLVLLMLLPLL